MRPRLQRRDCSACGAPEQNAEPTFADCESLYQEVLSHVSRKSIFAHGALASLLDEVAAYLKTGDDRKARLALHWYAPAKEEFAELRARGPAPTLQHLAAAGSSVATPAQQAHPTAAPGPALIPADSCVPTATPTSAAPAASNYPPHQLAAFGAAPPAGQPAGQPAQPSQDSRVPMDIAPAGTPSSAMPPSPMITSTLVSGALLGMPDVLERTATGSASGPPHTMSDALKRAVLGAAPRIFALERMTSGMAALLFHLISQEHLFALEGFASMDEYADKRLGVQSEANMKVFRRAGRAIWDNFPDLAMRAVEAVAGGVTFVTTDGALPSLPRVSVLRELPAALRRVKDADERAALLERVEEGDVTYEELRKVGRPSEAPATTASTTKGQAAGVSSPGTAVAAEHVTPDFGNRTSSTHLRRTRMPPVFDDVSDLEQAAEDLRTVQVFFDRLAKTYSENPERDVRPILPLLVGFVDRLGVLLDALEDRVIPSDVCASCEGNDDLCTICGGAGWVPRAGRHAADTRSVNAPTTGPGSRSLLAAKEQSARSSGNVEIPGATEPQARPVSDNHDDHMVEQTAANNAEKKTLKRGGNRAGRKAIPPKTAPITTKASRAMRSTAASRRTAPSTKAKRNKKKAK